MKKIFLVLLVGLITVSLSGQSIFKRGIKVGNAGVTIDSISGTNTDVKMYNGSTIIWRSIINGNTIFDDITESNLPDTILVLHNGKIYYTLASNISSYVYPTNVYYIATTGSDITGDGSSGNPWASLSYACAHATTAGDLIHVNVGTYTETSQSVLSPGVSIEGDGNTSIIHSHVAASNPTIILSSTTEGTNGNQSISFIKMEGSAYTAHAAILVDRRKNVEVHHCYFTEFSGYGVAFQGSSSGEPTTYAIGNKFYNNTVIDCAGNWNNYGNLQIGGQQDMLVYNNTITQIDRGADQWGFGIKFKNSGYNKGLKIHDNTVTLPDLGASSYHIAIELWNSRGGIEVYNNTIVGTLDFSCNPGSTIATNDAGGYGYAAKVYGNTMGCASAPSFETYGVVFEHHTLGGVQVYRNTIRNVQGGVYMTAFLTGEYASDIDIYSNLITRVGLTTIGGSGIAIGPGSAMTLTLSDINIWNNTVVRIVGSNPPRGIWIRGTTGVQYNGLSIRNNIVKDFVSGDAIGIWLDQTTVNLLSLENNLTHGNGTNIDYSTATLTNQTIQNNIVGDPLFVALGSNYHISLITSPAYHAGLDLNIATDVEGSAYHATTPTIGAYEFH